MIILVLLEREAEKEVPRDRYGMRVGNLDYLQP
jgi:hypothetical protein